MTMPNLQARRATVEDLPALRLLWEAEGLPADQLTPHFGEFQLVEIPGGAIQAAIALQVAGLEGRLHCEAFADAAQADALRARLYDRVQGVAKNHGLLRLWTQLDTPFWHHMGLKRPDPEVLAKLPPAFAKTDLPWSYLQLKEETGPPVSLDKEFAIFKEAEQERTQRIHQQAKLLKLLAAVIVTVVFALVAALIFYYMRARGLQSQ
ncbi:MAG: hypothetical protein RJA22_1163 [Verrucomicrobiota bacterium]|jgi:N-acetylglutamate synthase-like GNAT family acetyltransferase